MSEQKAEAVLARVRAAEQRGDTDAANDAWREFVRLLWEPMRSVVAWDKKEPDHAARP